MLGVQSRYVRASRVFPSSKQKLLYNYDDPLPDKMERAGEEKRSLVLPSRSFHKAGYLVDTPPKGHWQWITGQRASQRVQVSG